MTFEYDEFADNLWVSISKPSSACVYVESETPGVLLRVEETSGIIRGFEITAWKRRLAVGAVFIPEISNEEFCKDWVFGAPVMARV
jgi:hypothetical protein